MGEHFSIYYHIGRTWKLSGKSFRSLCIRDFVDNPPKDLVSQPPTNTNSTSAPGLFWSVWALGQRKLHSFTYQATRAIGALDSSPLHTNIWPRGTARKANRWTVHFRCFDIENIQELLLDLMWTRCFSLLRCCVLNESWPQRFSLIWLPKLRRTWSQQLIKYRFIETQCKLFPGSIFKVKSTDKKYQHKYFTLLPLLWI